jgi:hypothetical protein
LAVTEHCLNYAVALAYSINPEKDLLLTDSINVLSKIATPTSQLRRLGLIELSKLRLYFVFLTKEIESKTIFCEQAS